MHWPKFLTYGNWGGPGWSGGKFTDDPDNVDWDVEAIDEMDELFKRHDYAYQHSINRSYADMDLAIELEDVKVKGMWKNVYRIGAYMVFTIKGLFM